MPGVRDGRRQPVPRRGPGQPGLGRHHRAVHRRPAPGPAAQDAAVQRRGAGRGAPGRVRRQPLLCLLPPHARRGDPARRRRCREPERPDRGRDHQGERAAVADHRGPARPARPPGRGPAARGRELRDEGHVGADRPAAGLPDGPGVRASFPDGPHPGAHPDRRRRGAAVGPGADRRAREGPPAQGPCNADERAAGPGPVRGPGPGHPGAAPDERRHHPPLAGELARPGRDEAFRRDLGTSSGRHARVPERCLGAPVPDRPAQAGQRVRRRGHPPGLVRELDRALPRDRRAGGGALPAPAAAAPRGRGRAGGADRRRRRHPRLRAAARSRRGPAAGRRRGPGRDARLRHLPLAAGRPPGTARRVAGPAVPQVPVHRDARRDGRPGVPEGLLPAAVLGAASVQGGHRRAHRRHDPRPARTGGAGLPRRHPVQRPERPVLHPDPGTRHRHRRPVRGHPRLGAAPPGQLRAARGPRRDGAPGTRSWSPSPGAGNASSTSSPNPGT